MIPAQTLHILFGAVVALLYGGAVLAIGMLPLVGLLSRQGRTTIRGSRRSVWFCVAWSCDGARHPGGSVARPCTCWNVIPMACVDYLRLRVVFGLCHAPHTEAAGCTD